MTIKEKTYVQMLKETAMMTHVGSGPKDPAPKEKETKSPVTDSKGEGTQQAGTKDPNKIPALSALKKELAKEGIAQKLLDHEKFIPFLEHIISQISEEEIQKHIQERNLPERLAKNIKEFKNNK